MYCQAYGFNLSNLTLIPFEDGWFAARRPSTGLNDRQSLKNARALRPVQERLFG